jgi:peptidyl-prolyl cis-trans isomerase A (cyclophilin A)
MISISKRTLQAVALAACALSLATAAMAQTSQPASKPTPATDKAGGKPATTPAPVPEKVATVVKTKLLKPAELKETAPATFQVKFETSAGDFVVEATRAWAPNGVDRFYNLVKNGYYDDVRFFRVIPGFMAQFGIHGDPAVSAAWREANIPDDKVTQSNKRGFVTFATAGPGTRTSQLFINFADRNAMLDAQGFSPIGKVITGMEVVDKLYGGYGEGAPQGTGPNQGNVQMQGNEYLMKSFPKLDYIKTARIVK